MPSAALIESIEAVRRRARFFSLAYGCGLTIALSVGLLVAVVISDYVLNLQPVPRLIFMIAAIGSIGYLINRFIIRPAIGAASLSDIAGRLERAFPQFEDRLRSTVNFAGGANPGSAVLQQRVIDQAAGIAGGLDLSQAVVARPAAASLGLAGAAVIAVTLIATFALNSNIRSIIASRFFTPFSAAAWPKRVQIAMQSTVPQRVPVGQRIDLKMNLTRGDKASMKPVVYYRLDDGQRQQMFMTREADGSYTASLDARLEPDKPSANMTAWIEAGDDRRELGSISIVPRLTIRRMVANVTPPKYVPNRRAATSDLAAAPVVTAEGSDVALEIEFNKPLDPADPSLEAMVVNQVRDGLSNEAGESSPAAPEAAGSPPLPAVKWSRTSPNTAVAAFRLQSSLRFHLHATDADGFKNSALEEYEFIVRPDTNLSLQIEEPRRSDERTPEAYVPMQAMAEDDCGVEWVKLVVDRLSPDKKQWTIDLVKDAKATDGVGWQPVESSPQRTRQRLNYKFELKPLDLKTGDVIEYHVLARDNFDLDGRRHDPVASSKLRITVISQEDLAAAVTNVLRSDKTIAAQVRNNQDSTMRETEQLGQDVKDKPKLDAPDKMAIERLSQQQSSAAASAKQLAARMGNSIDRLEENRSEATNLKNIAETVRKTFDEAAENEMKSATGELNDANRPDSPAENRNGKIGDAQKSQQGALDKLDTAMAKLEDIGSLQTSIAEIAKILNEQKKLRDENEAISKNNLGKTPEQMSPDDKKKLDATAAKQEALAERTRDAIDKMSKQGKEMEKSDPSASDAMKSAAAKGQQSGVSAKQQQAAQQTRQNQQASAQASQQAVELGLQMMLNDLKEAERRELARLREKLAQLQEQVATLVRRQAGHNLDNLLLQGPVKLKGLDPDLIATLTTLSTRKADDLKPTAVRTLSSGQELTERNTRDIGKSAAAEATTADIGNKLTLAAGRMERAIVELRANKVAEAYDPPQIEALAALLEAQKTVEEQKKEADQKQQDQQRDAIRARYEKIRDRQKVLNDQTAEVEKARDGAGELARKWWPVINGLPKDQGTLAEETAKIEEDLVSLDSIVFVWANKDIRNTMTAVKDDLVGARTGRPTQAEQTRVVGMLDALIASLVQSPPKEEKFEKPGGGGGGGGGGGKKPPKMPPEAELRLLKSLQQAVNSNTVLSAAEAKEVAKLTALGNRQGELRNLLSELLEKASQGKLKLGAEPENKNQLPEELADKPDENKEGGADVPGLEADLLGEDVAQKKVDRDFKLVGIRMGRSRQRLALDNDPGKVTQSVQEKILLDLDGLIAMAQQAQQQQSSSSAGGQPKPGAPKPGEGQQANNTGANKPGAQQPGSGAGQSPEGAVGRNSAGAGSKPHDLNELQERSSEWGNVTPRVRDAVIESKGETVVESYKKLIEDYYEALSRKNTGSN